MKNLENLTTEEMRTMLVNILDIVDRIYEGLTCGDNAILQIEQIGMEYFEEEIPETVDQTLSQFIAGMNEEGQEEFVKNLNAFIKSENEQNPEITLDSMLSYSHPAE